MSLKLSHGEPSSRKGILGQQMLALGLHHKHARHVSEAHDSKRTDGGTEAECETIGDRLYVAVSA
jgi:hypothetical protein